MAKEYSATQSTIKAGSIDQQSMASIGRIIRAFAEIEDLVTLFICNLAEISESKASVIVGPSALSRKLQMADYLSKLDKSTIYDTQKALFGAEFDELRECRNTVAHGVFLGLSDTEDDQPYYAFLTSRLIDPQHPPASAMVVVSYAPSKLAEVAERAEALVPAITRLLKLETLRQRRLPLTLWPHPKGQSR